MPGGGAVTRKTTVRAAYDSANAYFLIECELPADTKNAAGNVQEAVSVYLAPAANRETVYRFSVGPKPESKNDAASGFVTDAMDPRHGQFDPDWNGNWTYESRVEPDKNRWVTLLKIPAKTLGAEGPKSGMFWRANFTRVHVAGADRVERSLWSTTAGTKSMEDRNDFGELFFANAAAGSSAALPDKTKLQTWRDEYNRASFEIPPEWKNLSDPLPTPLGNWIFRADPLEQGVQNGWQGMEINETDWVKMRVPSFWAENEAVGDFQGFGWYRATFTVPENWSGKSVRLCFASVDEQAWVYVNAQLVREHSEKSEKKSFNVLWEEPFTADVPAAVKGSSQSTLKLFFSDFSLCSRTNCAFT